MYSLKFVDTLPNAFHLLLFICFSLLLSMFCCVPFHWPRIESMIFSNFRVKEFSVLSYLIYNFISDLIFIFLSSHQHWTWYNGLLISFILLLLFWLLGFLFHCSWKNKNRETKEKIFPLLYQKNNINEVKRHVNSERKCYN